MYVLGVIRYDMVSEAQNEKQTKCLHYETTVYTISYSHVCYSMKIRIRDKETFILEG